MKLSEAIFLGSKLGTQAFEAFKIGDATCALGAAAEAVHSDPDHIDQIWPILATVTNCPIEGCEWTRYSKRRVDSVIAHLNDPSHLWTRERIADWVATLEPKEPEAPPVENQSFEELLEVLEELLEVLAEVPKPWL